MANQVIVLDRLIAIERLEKLLADKKKEHEKWVKDQKSYKSRLKAWEKKAVAYIRKNGKFEDLDSLAPDYDYREQSYSLDFTVDADKLIDACGERPVEEREPEFYNRVWVGNTQITPEQEVKNAIALYKLSSEPTVKVNTKTLWAAYIA